MAPFYGCRDPGTKLDGVKLAPVTAKTSKTGPRHGVIRARRCVRCTVYSKNFLELPHSYLELLHFAVTTL